MVENLVKLNIQNSMKNTMVSFKKVGGRKRRICSGRCGDVELGPIDCPVGYSPHLNCVANPPTLTCVRDSVKRKRRK